MNERFIRSVYKTVVEDGKNIYRDLYENTERTESTVDYWKKALEFYHALDDNQKIVFIDIIEQTMVDTISSIFGVLDGSGTLAGEDFEFDVKINGISTEDEVQDTFLEFIEEKIRITAKPLV